MNLPPDVLRHMRTYLPYPDVCTLDACEKSLHASRDPSAAFKYARQLVHRPWILPGRCAVAGCTRIKCTSFMADVPFTISNYCWNHSGGRRATTFTGAYIMQPPWVLDAC